MIPEVDGMWMSVITVSVLKAVIAENSFGQIVIRSDGSATALVHKSCAETLFQFSGASHIFTKPHVADLAWKDMGILWLFSSLTHGRSALTHSDWRESKVVTQFGMVYDLPVLLL